VRVVVVARGAGTQKYRCFVIEINCGYITTNRMMIIENISSKVHYEFLIIEQLPDVYRYPWRICAPYA